MEGERLACFFGERWPEAGGSLSDSGLPIPTGRVTGDFNDRHGGFHVRLARPSGCSVQLGLHLDDVFADELFPELPLGTGTSPGAVLCLRHLVGKSSSGCGLDVPMFDPSGHGSRFSFRRLNPSSLDTSAVHCQEDLSEFPILMWGSAERSR